MTRLLVLSEERIAAERRWSEDQVAADGVWRRATRRLIWRCGLVYAAGTLVAFSSMGLTDDLAQVALWGGLLLGNGAWFTFLIAMWAREAQ